MEDFLEKVVVAIEQAEASGRLVAPEGVTGLAGERTAGLLQRCAGLLQGSHECYLEVGVFQGFTLASVAAAAPALACFGIDDFSQFDAEGKNRSIVEARLRRHASGNATLLDRDFEQALLALPLHLGERRIGVYFVDGPHDYRSQLLCLELARPWLSERAVIVVDDSNYEHVRRANADWLRFHPEFALLFEAYSAAHPDNLSPEGRAAVQKEWWNGVNVMVRDAQRRLPRAFPPVDADRARYFNDHLVHPARDAEMAPELLAAVAPFSPRALLRLVVRLLRSRRAHPGRHARANTYSAGLPSRRIVQPGPDPAVDR